MVAQSRTFPGTPPPCGPRKDARPDGTEPKRIHLGKRAPAEDPSHRAPEPPRAFRSPPRAAAASTHRARRWAGPLGTGGTAAPPRFRRGVSARHSPSGPPPGPRLAVPRRRRRPRLHGEGKRLRGDWAGGGDGGGGGPGSELDRVRARPCQRRTRRSLAPDAAWAVRRALIGRSEAGAGWPTPSGCLRASRAPPLRAGPWGAESSPPSSPKALQPVRPHGHPLSLKSWIPDLPCWTPPVSPRFLGPQT